ncbi:serine protease [Methylobacterium nigriterrae]|uniref:serine protease n=1 Tax=Methylobacterium nigriterrae TaxID=3127512 RepID=UPI003D66A6C8
MVRRARFGLVAGLATGLAATLWATDRAEAQAPAASPRPKPPAPAAPAPDRAFDSAKAAYEALPEAERRALQDALTWTGDYNSVVAGTFGRRTFEALNAFRARSATPAADPLDPRLRAAILAAGEAARRSARFAVQPDAASGAVLGVPERLLTKRAPIRGGTRWQSQDGRVTLESRSFPPGGTDLDALFERATAPLNDRKITYSLKRPDFIVVTGETGTGKSYTRYAAGPEGVRGFALGYERALAGEVDRLVIAIANSFVPFPGPGAGAAAAPPAGAAPPPVAAPTGPAATGLAVGPGRILTAAAALEACAALRIEGAAARILKADPGRGLALLEASAPATAAPPSPRADPVAEGEALVAVAAGPGGVSVAPGSGAPAGGVFAPLQPGAAGAPVLDRSGALAGLVARFPAAPRLIAGVMPPASHALVPGTAVAAFLSENGIKAGPPRPGAPASLGAVAAPLAGAVVGIQCGG